MRIDLYDIAAIAFIAAAPFAATKIVFNDIGLREAVEDGSVLRARFYVAIGAHPERYNIPHKAYETGNCAIMAVLQQGGAGMERLYQKYGAPSHCNF